MIVPAWMRARHQRSVAPRIPHPVEIAPGPDAAPGEQLGRAHRTPQQGQQPEIDSASGADPAQVQHQDGARAGLDGPNRQRFRVGGGGRLQPRLHHRPALAEVEAEDDPVAAHGGHDGGQIANAAQGLQPDHDPGDAAPEQRRGRVGLGDRAVHQQRPCEGSQLLDQPELRRLALDGIEVGQITFSGAEAAPGSPGAALRGSPSDRGASADRTGW